MIRSFWKMGRWASRKAPVTKNQPVRRKAALSLETLEGRIVPSTYTNLNDSGAGSLRDAITSAAFGETISAAAGLSGSINLVTQLSNTGFKALTIVGQTDGSGDITLNGQDMVRIFKAVGNENVAFQNLTFSHGKAGGTGALGYGGAFQDSTNSHITFMSCNFNNNSAALGAGAIDATSPGGLLELDDCTFTNNTATAGYGGAITLEGCDAVINGTFTDPNTSTSTFTNNTAVTGGGAIDAFNGAGLLTISGTKFSGNRATAASSFGGAVDDTTYSATISGSLFTDNHASNGGALDVKVNDRNALITLSNTRFTANSATGASSAFGGAAEITNVSANIDSCTFGGPLPTDGNSAIRAGGLDLFANQVGYAVTFNVTDTSFVNNTAAGSGGLIVSLQSGGARGHYVANLQGDIFDGNMSTSTGATTGFGGGANFYAQAYSADLSGRDNGFAQINVGRSVTTGNPTEFKNNKSNKYGGGFAATVYASYGATATLNLGDTDGASDSLLIHDNSVQAAGSPLLGGGAYLQTKSQPSDALVSPTATITLQHAQVYGNSTGTSTDARGGGLYIENNSYAPTGSAVVNVLSSTIYDNTTAGFGGGAYVLLDSTEAAAGVRSTVNLTNDTIFHNSVTSATGNGGGLYIATIPGTGAKVVNLSSLTVAKNTASNAGGGVYVTSTLTSLTVNSGNSIYSDNTATAMSTTGDIGGPGTITSVAGAGLVGGYNILNNNGSGNHGLTDSTDLVGVNPLFDFAPASMPVGVDGLFLTDHSSLPVLGFLDGSPAVGTGDATNWGAQMDETDYYRPRLTPTRGAYDPNATSTIPPGGGDEGSGDAVWANLAVEALSKKKSHG